MQKPICLALSAWVLGAFAGAAQAATPQEVQAIGVPQPSAFALVVAIESYRDLPAATGARLDGERYLAIATKTMGIPPEHIRTAIDGRATRTDIEGHLAWLKANVTPNARVYFFFSGYGTPDPSSGTSFLVPYDADGASPKKSGLRLDDVLSTLNQSKAKEIFAFLDSGFSGQGARSLLPPGTRPLVAIKALGKPAKVSIFSAATGAEIAGLAQANQGGLFSQVLFDGLGNGHADVDVDGQVTASELQKWLTPRVANAARLDGREQTPEFIPGRAIGSPDQLPVIWGLSRSAGIPTQAPLANPSPMAPAAAPAYSAPTAPVQAQWAAPAGAQQPAQAYAPPAQAYAVPAQSQWAPQPAPAPQMPAPYPQAMPQQWQQPTYDAVQPTLPVSTQPPSSTAGNQPVAFGSRPVDGDHKHDGFFLQILGGGGYTTINGISKGTYHFEFALGWSLSDRLILSLRVDANAYYGSSGDLFYRTYGVGATYYLTPSNLYFSGTVGIGSAKASLDSGEEYYSDLGFGAGAMVGKEWWASSNWGIGPALRLDVVSISDSGESFTATSVSLLLSATYN